MMEPTTGTNEVGQDVSVFDAPNLSPEQHTEHTAGVLARAFEQTRLVEVVEVKANLVNQVHLLCRVKKEAERELVHTVVTRILARLEHNERVEAFIGKEFMLKRGKVIYAWVFSFASDDVREMAHAVCDAIDEARPRTEVLESPLMGSGTPQSSSGGRGAAPVG